MYVSNPFDKKRFVVEVTVILVVITIQIIFLFTILKTKQKLLTYNILVGIMIAMSVVYIIWSYLTSNTHDTRYVDYLLFLIVLSCIVPLITGIILYFKKYK